VIRTHHKPYLPNFFELVGRRQICAELQKEIFNPPKERLGRQVAIDMLLRRGLPVTIVLRSFSRRNGLALLYPQTYIELEYEHNHRPLSRPYVHPRSFRAEESEKEVKALRSSRQGIPTAVYAPLDSSCASRPLIRLLELLPGYGSHPLTARLKEVALSENILYEAISYCWGDPKDVSTIICNGQPLRVPRRLEVALRNMRHTDKPRMLWADAICINQSDVAEKETQVQLMRRIFSNAQTTLIWLGDVQEKQQQKMSKFALWTIKAGLSIFQWRVPLISSPQIPVWDVNEGCHRTLAPFSSEFYLELIGMLRMRWFQRAWVVQEVAVSSKATIFWGSSQYDWEDVIRALKFMCKANFPLAFIVTLENISTIDEERKFYRESESTLNGVLLRHQRCMATDPRDKIYSFCGLVKTSSENHTPVRISYKDDVPIIYREVALNILEKDRSLDLLSRPPLSTGPQMMNLPSWVPDWSTSSTSTLTYAWGHGPLSIAGTELADSSRGLRFAASGGSIYVPKISSTDDALLIEGYPFDKVVEVGPIFQGVQVPYNVESFPGIVREWIHCLRTVLRARKVFMRWQQVANLRSRKFYVTGETMREAVLQTVSAAEVHDADRVRVELELSEKGTRFPFGLLYSAFFFVWHFLTNKPFLVFEIQGRYALQRKVVRTEGGYLCLASNATAVGDNVMICKGSSVPLVMRRNEKDGFFQLVGDAYVHGIMRGEAFQNDKCHTIHIK
jgi:hypothetical protein